MNPKVIEASNRFRRFSHQEKVDAFLTAAMKVCMTFYGSQAKKRQERLFDMLAAYEVLRAGEEPYPLKRGLNGRIVDGEFIPDERLECHRPCTCGREG